MLSTTATSTLFFSPVLALIPLLLALLSSTSATDDACSTDPDENSMLQTTLQTDRSLQKAVEGSQIVADLAPGNAKHVSSELDSSLELSVQNDANTKIEERKTVEKGKDDKKANQGVANNVVDNVNCGACDANRTAKPAVDDTVTVLKDNISNAIGNLTSLGKEAVEEMLKEDPAKCLKDMTSLFVGDEFQCLLQNTCDYMVRVRCDSATTGGYWDYAPKGCCQIPPPEFNVAPCQGNCKVEKL